MILQDIIKWSPEKVIAKGVEDLLQYEYFRFRMHQAERLFPERSQAFADAQEKYAIELAKEELRLRDEEKLPVSMVTTQAKGNPVIADLRSKMTLAEGLLKSVDYAQVNFRREVAQIHDILQREWYKKDN